MGGRLLSKSHRTLSTPSFRLSTCSLRSIYALPDLKSSPEISPKISPRLPPVVPRCFSTRVPYSEFAQIVGLDYKHWLVSVEEPDPNMTRDEIIDMYVKMFASVVGSEQEARMKIYSVSTRYYYAFGALISKELSKKFEGMPKVVKVIPDCYKNSKEKDYGGEPFIDGQPVPYDPKYHAHIIEAENHLLGIGIDLEETDEEMEETEDTDD